jgi:hypothetical protein
MKYIPDPAKVRAARNAFAAEQAAAAAREDAEQAAIVRQQRALLDEVPPHPGHQHEAALELAYDGPIPRDALEAAREADRRAIAAWHALVASMQQEQAA